MRTLRTESGITDAALQGAARTRHPVKLAAEPLCADGVGAFKHAGRGLRPLRAESGITDLQGAARSNLPEIRPVLRFDRIVTWIG